MSRAAVAIAVLFGVFITAGRVPADEAALKKEIDALKAEVAAIKREVAALKGGGAEKVKEKLKARFDAASQVSDFDEKQKIYAALAPDAARAGDVELTKKTLGLISNFDTKQQTIYKAAMLLAKAGQEQEAVALAKTLSDFDLKQKALAKIAKGEYDE